MQYSIQHAPLQTLVTGDVLSIAAHQFTMDKKARSCYLQANLHGPEILGSALLIKLIAYLREHPQELVGNLTIVPQANPVGVQAQIYGYQIGRWNLQNGTNWNRIFSREEEKNGSIESILSKILLDLATGHDLILDIHTSGAACIPHLFTSENDLPVFSSLDAKMALLVRREDYYGAFDEACRFFAGEEGRTIQAATWEVGSHGSIEPEILDQRFASLLTILRQQNILGGAENKTFSLLASAPLKKLHTLHATGGGYFVWNKKPGQMIKRGETYGCLYHPKTGQITPQTAEKDFFFLIQYPLQAVASGQELGQVIVQ